MPVAERAPAARTVRVPECESYVAAWTAGRLALEVGQRASGEYAIYKARLERLLAEAAVEHDEIGKDADRVLQVKRGVPQ